MVTWVPRLLADLVDLVRLDRSFFCAIIFKLKFTTLVQCTAQVCFPLGWVGLVHTFLVFTCFQSPRLEDTAQGLEELYTGPCLVHVVAP